MKKMTLAALGLVSMVGLGLAGTAQAAKSPTSGTVSFDVDWSIQPPIKTDNIENPNPSSEAGGKDLSVIYAMNFEFGTHNYNGQALTDIPVELGSYTIPAVPAIPANPETGAPEVPEVPATPIKDVLGISIGNSGNTAKWNLYVSASEFGYKDDNDKTKTVNGLRMTLHNITARQVSGSIKPDIPSAASLEIDGTNKLVASYANDTTDPEMTITNFAFGTYPIKKDSDGKEIPDDTATTYKGVTLNVPNGKAIEKDKTYTSNITWTLAVDSI